MRRRQGQQTAAACRLSSMLHLILLVQRCLRRRQTLAWMSVPISATVVQMLATRRHRLAWAVSSKARAA